MMIKAFLCVGALVANCCAMDDLESTSVLTDATVVDSASFISVGARDVFDAEVQIDINKSVVHVERGGVTAEMDSETFDYIGNSIEEHIENFVKHRAEIKDYGRQYVQALKDKLRRLTYRMRERMLIWDVFNAHK